MLVKLSLLDVLAYRTGCSYLSDLRQMKAQEPLFLVRALEAIAYQDAPLSEWNDALSYLAGEEAVQDAAEARQRLLAAIRRAVSDG